MIPSYQAGLRSPISMALHAMEKGDVRMFEIPADGYEAVIWFGRFRSSIAQTQRSYKRIFRTLITPGGIQVTRKL